MTTLRPRDITKELRTWIPPQVTPLTTSPVKGQPGQYTVTMPEPAMHNMGLGTDLGCIRICKGLDRALGGTFEVTKITYTRRITGGRLAHVTLLATW
jgi:hypothetical protein